MSGLDIIVHYEHTYFDICVFVWAKMRFTFRQNTYNFHLKFHYIIFEIRLYKNVHAYLSTHLR